MDVISNVTGRLENSAGFSAGKVGQAFSFQGTNGAAVIVDDSPNLNPTTAITIEAWINSDGTRGNRRIVQKGDDEQQYFLLISDSGELWFQLALNGSVVELYANQPPPNNWHHIAATYNGTAMRLFIDGQWASETNVSGLIRTTIFPLYIGMKIFSSRPDYDGFHGLIDELAIYDRALSTNEIRAIYQAGSDGKCKQ